MVWPATRKRALRASARATIFCWTEKPVLVGRGGQRLTERAVDLVVHPEFEYPPGGGAERLAVQLDGDAQDLAMYGGGPGKPPSMRLRATTAERCAGSATRTRGESGPALRR